MSRPFQLPGHLITLLLRIALIALIAWAAFWQGSWAWEAYALPGRYVAAQLGPVPDGFSLEKYGSMYWLDGSLLAWNLKVSPAGVAALRKRCIGPYATHLLPLKPVQRDDPPPIEGCWLRTDPSGTKVPDATFVLAGDLLQMQIRTPQRDRPGT